MRRNGNLKLRLVPPQPLSDHQQQPIDHGLDLLGEDRNQNQNHNQHHNQQMTIFYGGRVSVCDVTDTQARAIIKVASEEIDEKWKSRTPLMPSPTELPMKVSLQRFLQKRKHRIQATSPYHH